MKPLTQSLLRASALLLVLGMPSLWAQPAVPAQQPVAPGQPGSQAPLPGDRLRPTYIVSPGDQILIRAQNVEEIGERPFAVDADGAITLPLVGKLVAAGKTLQQFETELLQKLAQFVVQPQVQVTLVQSRSEPVFLVGAFRAPGIYPLQGRRRLVELLTSAGGLGQNAARRLRVTRRAEYGSIPLPGAIEDSERKVSTVEIALRTFTENINPAEDIELQPFDVISVERVEAIFVAGAIGKPGAYDLGERETLSTAQLMALAGGVAEGGKARKAYILRPVLDTTKRTGIPVDIKQVMAGLSNDIPLMPNDILYIPEPSGFRKALADIRLFLPLATTVLLLGNRF